MAGRASRACDACRVRKVRCSGSQPCSQCVHLSLSCAFPAVSGKRKPPVRGRLVAQLREKEKKEDHQDDGQESLEDGKRSTSANRKGQSPSATSNSLTRNPGVTSIAGIIDPHSPPRPAPPRQQYPSTIHSHSSPPLLPVPPAVDRDAYSQDYFYKLVPDYEQVVYPVNPIITASEIREAIAAMHQSHEDAALVYAFGAATVDLSRTSWYLQGDVATQMKDLLQMAWRAHHLVDLEGFFHERTNSYGGTRVTVKRIMTCIFLEISLMAFKRFDRSFAVVREAIAMIDQLNVHKHSLEDAELPRSEVARRQRLYWELFIHERFLAIVSGYPTIMRPLRSGHPFPDDTLPSNIELGFDRLIHLFRTMNDEFFSYWSSSRNGNDTLPMAARWVENKQAELDADERGSLQSEQRLVASGKPSLTDLQHADLFITRLWLRTLVWELALNRNLLSTALRPNAHEGLSVHYPTLRLSSQLRSLVSRLGSVAAVGVHGSGILQKLFDITTTIANVLNLPFAEGQSQEDFRLQMEDFFYLVRFLFQFERILKEQRAYLRLELDKLQERYAGVVDFAALAGETPEAG